MTINLLSDPCVQLKYKTESKKPLSSDEKARFLEIAEKFVSHFSNHGELRLFSAPGRTEIGGNHTDHNHGRVLAAAVDSDMIAAAAPRDDGVINVFSEGFGMISSASDAEPDAEKYGTSESLLAGVAAVMKKRGYSSGGFDAYVKSRIAVGSGISSSAAFEVLAAQIENCLYNEGSIDALTLAKISQEAENVYFGKPCGLMDQTACAVGGFTGIDFLNPADPVLKPVSFDFSNSGYSLVLTNTHASHAGLTDQYASIPDDMKAAAGFFGREVLRGLSVSDILGSIPALRAHAGDRAVLRALHFIEEDIRAGEEADALEHGDIELFLKLVRESGSSSWRLLQNISVAGGSEQSLALALAVSDSILNGQGASRVHGGGFAGAIQAFVPHALCGEYIKRMDAAFGSGSAQLMKIRAEGVCEVII